MKKMKKVTNCNLGGKGDHRVSIRLTDLTVKLTQAHHTQTLSSIINVAVDNYFTFNLTLYIIVHRINNKLHIGYYNGDQFHDLRWHYVNSLGNGTLGDELRRDGFSNYRSEIIGKFNNINQLITAYRLYKKYYTKHFTLYSSTHKDDDAELLIEAYKAGKV